MAENPIRRGHYRGLVRRSVGWALVRNGLLLVLLLVNGVVNLLPREELWWSTIALNAGLITFAGWRVVVALRRLQDPARHPFLAELARYGAPLDVADELESSTGEVLGNVVLTERFLASTSWPHAVIRLADVAWIYAKTTNTSVNFVPVATTHSVEIHTWGPPHRVLPWSTMSDGPLIPALALRCPEARVGWDPGAAATWTAWCSSGSAQHPQGWAGR